MPIFIVLFFVIHGERELARARDIVGPQFSSVEATHDAAKNFLRLMAIIFLLVLL
jgi:hypothetical protein